MKKLTTLILLILIAGCNPQPYESAQQKKARLNDVTIVKKVGHNGIELKTIEFEGCEYVVIHGYLETAITHKGNCKFH